VNAPVDPEIGVPVIVPPVNATLPDVKFVTVPVVAANVVKLPVLPEIGVLVIAPPEICALAVVIVVKTPVEPLIGVELMTPPEICALPVANVAAFTKPAVVVPDTVKLDNVPRPVTFG
jgi:hypothetical protein